MAVARAGSPPGSGVGGGGDAVDGGGRVACAVSTIVFSSRGVASQAGAVRALAQRLRSPPACAAAARSGACRGPAPHAENAAARDREPRQHARAPLQRPPRIGEVRGRSDGDADRRVQVTDERDERPRSRRTPAAAHGRCRPRARPGRRRPRAIARSRGVTGQPRAAAHVPAGARRAPERQRRAQQRERDDGEREQHGRRREGASGYGLVVDRVNVSVLLYVPVRSASLAPIVCWNDSVSGSLATGPRSSAAASARPSRRRAALAGAAEAQSPTPAAPAAARTSR